MTTLVRISLVLILLISIGALGQRLSAPQTGSAVPAMPSAAAGANLPFQPLGPADLVRVTVTDAPELTQTFRIDQHGNLNLPLLPEPLHAAGLLPDQLRDQLSSALRSQHLLVNPVVDVAVVEYRSRDVIVGGAVKTPATVQDVGNLHLIEAISQAGGLLPEAGPDITVERPDGSSQRIAVRSLYDGQHPELNVALSAGSRVRVPTCDRVYVVGNVKKPGAFPFLDTQDTTVLQLIALSGGLDSFSRNKAYIYRLVAGNTQKTEIEVPLRRILDRKAADVNLAPNDILYVPTNGKLKASASVLNHVTGMGNTAVSAAIWSSH
jgi:polysaccharide export outer membrane protein